MGPLLFFNSGNEASCAIPLDKIEFINAGDQVINIYTGGEKKQKVALGCADDKSDEVLKTLVTALAPMAKFHQKLVVVADDAADEYLVSGLTTVTITVDED